MNINQEITKNRNNHNKRKTIEDIKTVAGSEKINKIDKSRGFQSVTRLHERRCKSPIS